jgi:Bax protein
MNIISGICVTLLLLCQTIISNFDFKYDNQDQFVRGIVECTQAFNAVIPPENRVVIVISVAQAGLESDWGNSRFAQLGNNFYGIIESNPEKPHIKALDDPTVLIKVYNDKCESVANYITLLNTHDNFKEYRQLRLKQFMTGKMDIDDVVDALRQYAIDPFYAYKVKDTIAYLHRTYPTLFHLTTPA